ncbi:nucleolar protein,nop52, putative [Entamoeba histolytica HM-1:IMSS-B]|uniref:Nucleolar protein,nop52 protein n=4 Tax=Entamoeba histolytica TaxID=5759 RepID=C4M977_ENTH1|nr:hypothetical protein, conserved [Entamoeba histolytica HM-1:IMSS]EAL44053.1 hypothetical protein, conserved [Entamoeba histolytica HM-1:IMSS]EMH77942.1 nucleolar protein,nop52, putative [Entamoeba histolytica HM-1:IMSS-B]ENY63777.1 nucleolar protein,nop52 protein, putative [Entamoeba histolytica HM-1:IMSS-A]GAT98203.1 hypothetical protein conserved [Entamoeba histolytica]|eukprot:XP_649440.1 hypothetical protein, conserved [Entamoeba histolytica HM-1:IMSS]
MTNNSISIGKIIAQKLSNEEPSIRDAGWKEAKEVLMKKDTNEEVMKEIWIGLYFWYWHSDGRDYQEKVRKEITSIMNKEEIDKHECILFVKVGMETLERYWDEIDYVRIKKYEMLLCQMIQKYLYFISQHGWNIEMIKEWNEYLLEHVVPLQNNPISLSFSTKVADYYYDYLNDVIYIDEAPEPNEEAKNELARLLIKYLKNGKIQSLHKSFEEARERLQTELYHYINLGDIVKNCRVRPVKEFNKTPLLGCGMEKVEKLRAIKQEKRDKKKKDKERKEKMNKKRKQKEEKKPKKVLN